MTKEELRNPQNISIERIRELSDKSDVLQSDIEHLIFWFEVLYRINLPMKKVEDLHVYLTMAKERGIKPLSEDT